MTTALTGFQIKLTDADAGMCQVNSVYDETEKQFVFQVCLFVQIEIISNLKNQSDCSLISE